MGPDGLLLGHRCSVETRSFVSSLIGRDRRCWTFQARRLSPARSLGHPDQLVGRELPLRQFTRAGLCEICLGLGPSNAARADLQVEPAPDAPDVNCPRQRSCHDLLPAQITYRNGTKAW